MQKCRRNLSLGSSGLQRALKGTRLGDRADTQEIPTQTRATLYMNNGTNLMFETYDHRILLEDSFDSYYHLLLSTAKRTSSYC